MLQYVAPTAILCIFLCIPNLVWAGGRYREQEVETKYYDATPNDGHHDAGTSTNPYRISENDGAVYEMAPKYYDATPNDGHHDAGTSTNPYIIRKVK